MMRRRKTGMLAAAGMVAGCLWLGAGTVSGAAAPKTLEALCAETYRRDKACPEDLCRLGCRAPGETGSACETECLPLACPDIDAEACPEVYCALMKNCSGADVCHYQMVGERPVCGDLAYAGQDVDCCPGMVRRCGVEFLDGTCDMEGLNSVYSLPICIPCGDGLCGQFEDACNCPEDCKKP